MAAPPPPPPPPPPLPPPVGSSSSAPAPSNDPFATPDQGLNANMEPQSISSHLSEEKIWERSWTVEELRKGSSNWTLAADAGLLHYLQEFSQKMISQTHEIETQVDGLVNSTKGMDSKVQNTMNDFLMLSNAQFIENRVYEEDVSKDENSEEKEKTDEPEKAKTREQREAEVIPKISEALKHGISVMDNAFVKLELTTEHSDNEDDEDEDVKTNFVPQVILEPKDVYVDRPLPHLIGTSDFFRDELVGLGESSGEEDEGEDEEESETSSSESETESSESEASKSETSESSESETEGTKVPEKKQKQKAKAIESDDEDDEDLFGEKKKNDFSGEDSESEEEEETSAKPKGGLDFASELAAKIGIAPPKQQHNNEELPDNVTTRGERNGDEPQGPQTPASEKLPSETRSRSESKSKEKKSHRHHHNKKERSESHSEHKHRKRLDSKSSRTSVDTRQSSHAEEDLFGPSSPQEDGLFEGTGSPFGKKKGLFSGGGNLFDDVEEKDDLFSEEKSTEAKAKEQVEDEESVLIKPRARSTASGKKIPAGAVSIFGASGLFDTPTKEDLSITKQETQSQESETKAKVKNSSVGGGGGGEGGGGGGLFHDDDDDEGDLFSGQTSKATSSVQESTKQKPSSKKVELFGDDNDEDGEDGDLFSEKSVSKKPVHAPNKEKADSGVFSGPKAEVKAPLVSQPSKSSSGGGLFSDDDGDDGGGLFAAPVAKSQSTAEPKSRPKAKTTISLFDDDEQDDEQDFFAPSAVAKATSVEAKKESTNEKPTEQPKGTKPPLAQSSFDDDANDLFSSSAPKVSPPPIAAPKVEKKENMKTPSKIKSLFDADDDEGMFGEADDIFSASPDQSPQKASEPVSSVSAAIGQSAPQVAQKPSLFSDEEEDLFSSASDGKCKEKEEQVDEIPKVRKPVGGVSMFGGVDLFGGKKPSFSEEKNENVPAEPTDKKQEKAPKPVVAKKGEDLIGNGEDEDELFSSKPKTTKPPVVQKKTKPSSDLFGDSTEEDLFSVPPNLPADVKPVKAPESSETDVKPVKPVKPAGAVSMFGGVDLFGAGQSPSVGVKSKPQGPPGGDEDEQDLFVSKQNVKSAEKPSPEGLFPLPVPKVTSSPTRPSGILGVSPKKPGSGIEKLQKSLAFNPAMLRPGAAPPKRELDSSAVTFEEPADVRTLESANKERARIQVKRRPPTRQARRAAATTSASDETLFGSAVRDEASASSRVSWGGFPSRGLDTGEVDSAVSRTNMRGSGTSDDFFGFTSSKSSKIEKEEMSKTLDKSEDLAEESALFANNSDLLVNAREETELLNEVSNNNKEKPSSASIGQNDLSSVNSANEDIKNKNTEQLIGVQKGETVDDLFASSSSSTTQTKPTAVAPTASISQILSSPDDENLFSAGREKTDVKKSTEKSATLETKPTAVKEGKIGKDLSSSPLDEDLFTASQGKKEITVDKKQEKLFSSPFDDDDLFGTSASTQKATKSSAEETAKRTASQLTDTMPPAKPSSVLDEDDDLFSFKKAETRKPKRVVKPLGDDDLFGDSGNIFDDIPSKPKEKRKKKSATVIAAPKDDIFAEETAAGGGPVAAKTAKKTTTKTKRKTEKKTNVSIFDDEAPSIFDDPLNATSK